MVECDVVVKGMVRQARRGTVRCGWVGFSTVCFGRSGTVGYGGMWFVLAGKVRLGVVWCSVFRLGGAWFGRLGEVGLVVVWKVLSGRLGKVRFGFYLVRFVRAG